MQKNIWPWKASHGKLMMWFFLISDIFTFASLLIAYGFIRYLHLATNVKDVQPSQIYWPIPEKVFHSVPFLQDMYLPLIFVGIMTFVLILSSVTMVLAVDAGKRMDQKKVEKWLFWTIVGGIIFLCCQAWEWSHFIAGSKEGIWMHIFQQGTWIKKNIQGANLTINEYGPPAFAAFFFVITGFHGLHVLSGVVLNIIIYYRTVVGYYQKENYLMVEKVGLYWHFVDVVWLFVFTFFYLI